jgi:hypothetical protein
MSKVFIIVHKDAIDPLVFPDSQEIIRLYWSNETGWGDKDTATMFTEEETHIYNLPINGKWIEK